MVTYLGGSTANAIEAAAPSLGVKSILRPVGDSAGIERLILTLSEKPDSGLIFLPDAFTSVHREAIVAAVAQHRLPAIYPLRFFCDAGGLISYGIDVFQLYQQAVSYVSLRCSAVHKRTRGPPQRRSDCRAPANAERRRSPRGRGHGRRSSRAAPASSSRAQFAAVGDAVAVRLIDLPARLQVAANSSEGALRLRCG